MNKVRKAVITAAGRGTRMYPATTTIQKEMLPVMDRDGICKPAIQIIIEEALGSGIEEVCLVVNPHNRGQIEQHFAPLGPEEMKLFKGKDWALLQTHRDGPRDAAARGRIGLYELAACWRATRRPSLAAFEHAGEGPDEGVFDSE